MPLEEKSNLPIDPTMINLGLHALSPPYYHVFMPNSAEITALLNRMSDSDPEAINELFDIVYDDLRKLAHAQLRKLRPGDTLNTTGLVHRLYLKLVDQKSSNYQSRLHFFAVSAKAMRHIIINYARKKAAKRHGGGMQKVNLEDIVLASEEQAEVILALDESLQRLTNLDQRLGQVVEMRFFGGMTEKEIGDILSVNERTIRRDWTKARTILTRMMET